MQIFEKGAKLIVKAPAKLNLFLEVLGRRADGYHEIETVMQTVSLYDVLTLERSEGDVRLLTESPDIPHDRENLVVKAAELLREHAGEPLGAVIHLEKHIPVGAGLGGGSSDAVAALVGLNRLWELALPREVLHDLAARLGSDTPFFLTGGTALCRGRGERVAQLMEVRSLTYVVVYPGLTVSTKEVYEKLPADLTKDGRDTKLFLGEITSGAESVTYPHLFNRLECITLALHQSLKDLRQQMTESGLERVTMTGSGSAFFGIATGRKEAQSSAERLRRTRVGEVFVVERVR